MKQMISLVAVSLLTWVALFRPALAGGSAVDLTIVYSNNINGYIQPCPS